MLYSQNVIKGILTHGFDVWLMQDIFK